MTERGVEQLSEDERPRMPEVSRRASEFMDAVQTTDSDSPITFDLFTPGGISVTEFYEHTLKATDRLYERHDELFLPPLLGTGSSNEPDFEKILDLTHKIVLHSQPLRDFRRGGILALSTLQLAEAGARMVCDPSLVAASDNAHSIHDITERAAQCATNAYDETLSSQIKGDLTTLPNARFGYVGALADMHFAFWKARLASNRLTTDNPAYALSPELVEDIQTVLLRFPQKHYLFDGHDFWGRTERSVLRPLYIRGVEAFKASLEKDTSTGHNLKGNIYEALKPIFKVLDLAVQAGYTPEEALQIAVHNSAVIGRLTERGTDNIVSATREGMHLVETSDLPDLVIDHFPPEYELPFPEAADFLAKRDQVGSKCPVRYSVLVGPNSQLCKNIKLFSAGVKDRIGIEPPLLSNGNMYLDPAALIVNYVIFATSHN